MVKPETPKHKIKTWWVGCVECACGWKYEARMGLGPIRTRDDLLDGYNTHRKAMEKLNGKK